MQQPFATEWLAQLIEALPIGVYILDSDGNAVYENSEAQSLLGRAISEGERSDNLRERYAVYIAGTNEPYPTSRLPIVRALAGERVHVDDLEIDRDGRRVPLEVTATPIYDEGGRIMLAVAVFQDITMQRRTSEELERQVALRTRALEQALSAKSVFLMNVSHELRTPLSHIIGFNELLAERVEDDRSRKLAATAQTSGLELLEKIDNLIELARAESDAPDPSLVRFNLDTLLHEVARRSNLRIVGGEPLGVMRGDPQMIEEALRILVERASEDATLSAAVDAGGVRVSIQCERLAHHVSALADIRLALVRARVRAIGGDVIASREDCVDLLLPRLDQMHDVRQHEDA